MIFLKNRHSKRWLLDLVWGITLNEYKMNQNLAFAEKSMHLIVLSTDDGKMLGSSKQTRK